MNYADYINAIRESKQHCALEIISRSKKKIKVKSRNIFVSNDGSYHPGSLVGINRSLRCFLLSRHLTQPGKQYYAVSDNSVANL